MTLCIQAVLTERKVKAQKQYAFACQQSSGFSKIDSSPSFSLRVCFTLICYYHL
uniref:Uncharacterized protein n=1 Tax=Arundo donax TaxID=35708 RepID=A0A0A9DT96_ARUDO